MEELSGIAMAYYDAAPDNMKKLATDFFDAMDNNEDGEIQLHEFLAFTKKEGHTQMSNRKFFDLLNEDGSGRLVFSQVLTLFYIITSGRPFCDGCDSFVKGLYFTCVKCFEDGGDTFNVCSNCFKAKEYVHDEHKDDLLDNFVLLENKRKTDFKEKQIAMKNLEELEELKCRLKEMEKEMAKGTAALHKLQGLQARTSGPVTITEELSRHLVLFTPPRSKRSVAFRALQLAIGIGNIASSSSCSIM